MRCRFPLPLTLGYLMTLLAAVGLVLVKAQAAPVKVAVVTSERSHPAVQFGARELRAALGKAGNSVETRAQASAAGVVVVVAERSDAVLKSVSESRTRPADTPESYAISVVDSNTVVVEGNDAIGAMYGALDLAEQVAWAAGREFPGLVKPAAKTPFLAIRGINTFLTPQGFDEPGSWYWSDSFWERFLDMMAHSRHNFLDLHGPFDITCSWPNGFSYFVYLPDFPEVGVGRGRAAKNLARFRQIIQMAANRGVKVGYMNYTAAAPIGPWNTGRFWNDERFVPRPQEFLADARLEEYTRKAAGVFLKGVPELWMFGFRIGESGQPEDFYKKTYVEAVKELPVSLNVYARTWIADPQKVRELAELTKRPFYIEPKYNGEHLGSPYQAVTGGRYYPPSGSWEDYSNYPRNYSIIWQIRANGTHRVFHWGWPEFARRTMRSCKFAGGVGFSMEPMNSYYPQDDYLHNNPETKHNFYDWMFEQQWFWYLIWGRTAYDPDVDDRVWLGEFERRFGREAGPRVFNALAESSKIVPLVYSYHNQGLDHQHMAPEFETGDHALSARNTIWQGKRLVPFGGSIEEFLSAKTLDRTAMASPACYVDLRLRGVPDGRMTPFEAADYLDAAAASSETQIQQAEKAGPMSKQEFECIKMDIQAVTWLARYYADRIRSATHLEFYRRTYHHPELTLAHEHLQRAVAYWDRLSDVTEQHFGYVPELIRMRVYKFRWRDEGRSLGLVLEDINRMEEEFLRLPHRRSALVGHVPPGNAEPGRPLTVIATLASGPYDVRLYLFYRASGDAGYTKAPMRPLNQFERTWVTEVPPESMTPGRLEYYFEAYEGVTGAYGGTLEHRPPYAVPVSTDRLKPAVSHTPPSGVVRGSAVRLSAKVEDNAGVRGVRVVYKRMPAYHEWLPVEMKLSGGNLYTADVPVTPEGILYYFEAVDENENAARYPDFLQQTPYFVIDGWDPGTGPASQTPKMF